MRVGHAPRLAYSPAPHAPESIWPAWLAAAVITQAVRDASSTSISVDLLTRASAGRFLAGSKAFLMWCDVAGFDPDRLRLLCRARQLVGRAIIPRRADP
jgi:hypothetical protein